MGTRFASLLMLRLVGLLALGCNAPQSGVPRTDDTFYGSYTSRRCRQLLEGAGFTVERHERFRVGWLWGMMQGIAG